MSIVSVFAFVLMGLIYFSLYQGFIAYLILRPIVDWGWDIKIVSGISILAIASLIPVSVIILKPKWWSLPNQYGVYSATYKLLVVFILYAFLHLLQDMSGSSNNLFNGIDSLIRLLCGFSAAVLFLILITSEDKYKQLLITILIMGAIPAILVISQALGLIEGRSMEYAGHERITVFYHGSINIRQYFSFAILAMIALIAIGCSKRKKIQYLLLGSLSFIGMILIYSKAGIVFLLAVPILAYITLFKQKKSTFLILLIAPCILFSGEIIQYGEEIFFKEISSYEIIEGGSGEKIGALNGRLLAWRIFQDKLESASTFDLLVGNFDLLKIGFSGGVHNDYLLNLGRYGIMGLIIYSALVLSLIILSFIVFRVKKAKVEVRSRLFMLRGLVALWVIDSVGLHPSMYPVMLFLVFGFMAIVSRDMASLRFNHG